MFSWNGDLRNVILRSQPKLSTLPSSTLAIRSMPSSLPPIALGAVYGGLIRIFSKISMSCPRHLHGKIFLSRSNKLCASGVTSKFTDSISVSACTIASCSFFPHFSKGTTCMPMSFGTGVFTLERSPSMSSIDAAFTNTYLSSIFNTTASVTGSMQKHCPSSVSFVFRRIFTVIGSPMLH